jgi:hypothetical protein
MDSHPLALNCKIRINGRPLDRPFYKDGQETSRLPRNIALYGICPSAIGDWAFRIRMQ